MVEVKPDRPAAPDYASAPQDCRVVLVITAEDGERRVQLGGQACYILGRSPALCDVALDIRAASRVHCCLAHDADGNVHLVDLNSGHGALRGRTAGAGGGRREAGRAGGSLVRSRLVGPAGVLHLHASTASCSRPLLAGVLSPVPRPP